MQELLYPGSGEGHNWRSIIFSLLVIGLVISGIVTAIYLLGYVDELLYWSGRRMRLEELLAGDLSSQRLPPAWVDSTHLVYQADDGALSVLDTATNNATLLVSNHTLVSMQVALPRYGPWPRPWPCWWRWRFPQRGHGVAVIIQRVYGAVFRRRQEGRREAARGTPRNVPERPRGTPRNALKRI